MTAGLAISNIAWDPAEESDVALVLSDLGVRAVEIAPTKVFDDPTSVTDEAVDEYRAFWADRGLSIVAFQSMLFGRPELSIFGEAPLVRATVDRLGAFIDLAGRMGAKRLVFGSPRNRRRPPGVSDERVRDDAIDVFSELGRRARAAGVVFCIEPNPPQYGCDFVTTAQEGADLVRAVGEPGFGLHLDVAGMTLAGDVPADEIRRSADILCHYHVSAPELGAIEDELIDHADAFSALRDIGYDQHVSVEMRPRAPGEAPARVRAAIDLVRRRAADVGFELEGPIGDVA